MTPSPGLPRWVEILLGLSVLLLAAPLLGMAALLIVLTSPGPVLFRQQRVGQGGRRFELLKFRTMPVNSGGLQDTLRGRNRVTPVGAVLRKLKIDELPELWNVVRGEMSLVGPRPEVPEYVDLSNALWATVLSVRPGLTDPVTLRLRNEEALIAQSSGERDHFYRASLQPYKLRGYRDYIAVRTWLTDVRVLWRTALGIVFSNRVNPPSQQKLDPAASEEARHARVGRLQTATAALTARRRLWIAVGDVVLMVVSSYVAFWLRFDGAIPVIETELWTDTILALIVIRVIAFLSCGLFDGMWRYTSVSDLRSVFLAVTTGSLAFYLLIRHGMGIETYPRSVFVIDSLVLVCLAGGLRLAYRFSTRGVPEGRDRRLLIVGAGDTAESIVRDVEHSLYHRYVPVGFVDNDKRKVGRRIHGLPVLGTIDDLPTLMVEHDPDEVLIALPRVDSTDFNRILNILGPFNVAITTSPYVAGVPKRAFSLSQVRRVELADVLTRMPVRDEVAVIRRQWEGRRVLITGAAGTIGAEICRQLVGIAGTIVLFDRDERSLSNLLDEIRLLPGSSEVVPVVGDVLGELAIHRVIADTRPEVIVHGAAYRHELLRGRDACAAVRNNVTGTRIVAEAAAALSVERVLLLSSRSAVDPTSNVGAALRLAEQVLRAVAMKARTPFGALRLGPVLTRSEGVMKRFAEQIAARQAVTVTDPRAEQVFLFPDEAAHAAMRTALSMLPGGGVFAASTGSEQVLSVAQKMIRLSGFVLDEDISVRCVGLRAGERLDGRLVGLTETSTESGIGGIVAIPAPDFDPDAFLRQIKQLETAAQKGETDAVTSQLSELVPTLEVQSPGRPIPQLASEGVVRASESG